MTFTEFTSFLGSTHIDTEDQILKALWLDASGKWKEAHAIIDPMSSRDASWVHAYLHRKEGDIWNADYWYRRADRIRPSTSLEEEWESIVRHFTT